MKGFVKGLITGLVIAAFIVVVYSAASFAFNAVAPLLGMQVREYDGFENKIDSIEEILESDFYEDFDKKDLEASAIKGYVAGLGDPYTTYYTKEEYKSFKEDIDGTYEGIGAYIGYGDSKDVLVIVSPIEGTPADEAGLKAQDIVLKVDDVEVSGKTVEDLVKLIKGPAGTDVVLTVLRDGKEKIIEITRNKIDIQTVRSNRIEGHDNIGYIRISSFDEVTDEQFAEQFNDMKGEIDGLILDLRYNPGGLTNVVSAIADDLLPKDLTIYYTEDKAGNRNIVKTATEEDFDKPIVVLVNEGSASASEILSGALKDHERAKLVGTTTFGKGLVQQAFGLKDGSMVKVTVSRYYTPDGNFIHETGIEPDIKVELPKLKEGEEPSDDFDTQMTTAIEEILKMIK